jgi:hypothetical protein
VASNILAGERMEKAGWEPGHAKFKAVDTEIYDKYFDGEMKVTRKQAGSGAD